MFKQEHLKNYIQRRQNPNRVNTVYCLPDLRILGNEIVQNIIHLPLIEVKIPSNTKKSFRGKNVKFLLKDEPGNATLLTHKKQVTTFTGEYGESNPKFW